MLHALELRALCTFEDDGDVRPGSGPEHEGCWTRCNFNGGGLFQLDYMLVSALVQGTASVVCGGRFDLNSDQRSFSVRGKVCWGEVRQDDYTQRGWAPKSENPRALFMKGVARDLCWIHTETRGEALILGTASVARGGFHLDSDHWPIDAKLRRRGLVR